MAQEPSDAPPKHVVAIGASAGGLSALQLALPHLPTGQGVAYVLAQHMDPRHPSLLDQILQRQSSLNVMAADDAQHLRPDHLYIIPPDSVGTVTNGAIHLEPADTTLGPCHTVDILFQSVAAAYGTHSIGIVLSGSGSDGLQGIRAIKAAEGAAIVQDPGSAEYAGMPGAIVHERLADVIVSADKVGEELARMLDWPVRIAAPAETEAELLHALVRVLVRKTGVAFDQYKESTLRRRIERRRIVTHCGDLAGYLDLVKSSETEAGLLMQDMLISVTDFFRDSATFESIRVAIETLVETRRSDEPIRVWVPGCATGEEAFSIAMLLAEALGSARPGLQAQVFATDIDEQAIASARKSVYLKTAVRDVPAALQEKYLVSMGSTCQVAAPVRDLVTFARHDILRDPPFSRLDLVSCRNMLIYFKRATQEQLISTFHYVLNPAGYLVLGPSESTGKLTELFDSVDLHSKVFRRRALATQPPALPRPAYKAPSASALVAAKPPSSSVEQRIRELVFDQYAPAGVVVDQRFNVIHTHGDTAAYVGLPKGNLSVNILDMVALSLRVELRLVLQKSEREQRAVRSNPVALESGDRKMMVTLVALPARVDQGRVSQTLVLFEALPVAEPTATAPLEGNADFRVRELEQELAAMRDHLQTNVEDIEASNEELQSVNEEYQSTTEELQSANEELQTTNEELQSTNEELSTVNDELKARSDELAAANRDLESILNTAVAGIVVLDRDLRVTRYSAASREIFDLLPTSIGRPLIAVRGAVDLALLSNEIGRAVSSGSMVERDLELGDKVFLVRLIPQPDSDDGPGGVVITFVEATRALAAARESRRLAAVLKDSGDAIAVQALDGRILAWNRGAEQVYGYTEAEALDMKISAIVPLPEREGWRALVDRVRAGEVRQLTETKRLRKDGTQVEVSIAATALVDENGVLYGLATTDRDLTPLRETEAQRRHSEFAHEARLATAGEMAAGLAHELNQPVTSIVHFCDVALSIAKGVDAKRQDELVAVLTDATAEAQRAGDIIRNLRRFLGRRESERAPHAVNAIITETETFMRPICEKQGIELHIALADCLPLVEMDKTQVGQVLVNLLRNSMDAMQGVDRGARHITVASRLDDNLVHSVQVTVTDTGTGIAPDTAQRLFEPFHTDKPNGLGMGLWMSRSIVESHGGRLWAEERAGGGAVFHFSLPQLEQDAAGE